MRSLFKAKYLFSGVGSDKNTHDKLFDKRVTQVQEKRDGG
ncbi:hypothetical protein PAENIP36_10590 [Paenibacillus sp. P36]